MVKLSLNIKLKLKYLVVHFNVKYDDDVLKAKYYLKTVSLNCLSKMLINLVSKFEVQVSS